MLHRPQLVLKPRRLRSKQIVLVLGDFRSWFPADTRYKNPCRNNDKVTWRTAPVFIPRFRIMLYGVYETVLSRSVQKRGCLFRWGFLKRSRKSRARKLNYSAKQEAQILARGWFSRRSPFLNTAAFRLFLHRRRGVRAAFSGLWGIVFSLSKQLCYIYRQDTCTEFGRFSAA